MFFKKLIFVTGFLLKSIKDSFVDSVEGAVPGTVVEAVLVPGTVVEAVLVLAGIAVGAVAGTAVEAVPGTAVEAVPGTAVEVVPGTAVAADPGTAVAADPGTAVEADPGTAVAGTVEAGHILAVGEVGGQAQIVGELAVQGPSRASGLHFCQILALEVRTEDYRSLRVALPGCWGRGSLEESDPSPSFSGLPSVSPAQTGETLPQ